MLKMTSVKKNYKDFTLDCTLEIKSGYVTGLVGRNGAGKPRLLKAFWDLFLLTGEKLRFWERSFPILSQRIRKK